MMNRFPVNTTHRFVSRVYAVCTLCAEHILRITMFLSDLNEPFRIPFLVTPSMFMSTLKSQYSLTVPNIVTCILQPYRGHLDVYLTSRMDQKF